MASESIVFFGSGPVAAKSLESLAQNFQIESVITKAVPTYHKGNAPVEILATSLNLPIIFASNKAELDDLFDNKTFNSSLGVVVDYGVIMSKKVIDSFHLGIINSHFSLLPQWRGADPITFSLLSGQPKTGVSLMLIEPTLDTGKLLTQKQLILSPDDTNQSLTTKLISLSNQLLNEYIPRYINGEIKPKNQPHPDRATYSRKLSKNDGIIDISKPADQIEQEIRAFLGWPGSRITVNDNKIIITKSHTSNSQTTPLDIKCGDGKYLCIDELIAPSGRKMSARDYLNGYKIN